MAPLSRIDICLIIFLSVAHGVQTLKNFTVEGADPRIIYAGGISGWAKGDCGPEAGAPGQTASFTFTGVAVYLSVVPGGRGSHMVASLTLDNDNASATIQNIDVESFGSFGDSNSCDRITFVKDNLEDKQHNVVLQYIRENTGLSLGSIDLTQIIYTTTEDGGASFDPSSTGQAPVSSHSTSAPFSPPTTTTSSPSNPSGNGPNLGLILGLVFGIGGVLVLTIISLLTRKRQNTSYWTKTKESSGSGVHTNITIHGSNLTQVGKDYQSMLDNSSTSNYDSNNVTHTIHRNAHNTIAHS